MTTRRTNGGSLVAILVVLLLGLGALAAPAEAATARAISVAAAPAATYAGSTVKYSGRVTKSPKGSLVRVQRKAGARWVTVASTRTTTSTGAYAVRAALPAVAGVYSYRAVAPGTGTLARAASKLVAVTALRRTSVTLAPSPAGAVNPGVAKLLVGEVNPFVPGTTGYVQRLSGSTWVTVTTVIIGTDGSISRAVTPDPAVTTSYRVVVKRAGLNAQGTSPTVVVSVNQPPRITTTSLPEAGQGLSYAPALAVTGKPGTWSVTGTLPSGIVLSTAGRFSGSSSTTGTFPITVKYTESSTGLSDTQALTLTVKSFVITTSTLPDGIRNAGYAQVQLAKSGGGAGTWSIPAGALPKGLALSTGGVISGVPVAHTGAYPFTVTFKETSTGRTATKALSITVGGDDVAITTGSLPDATRMTPYSQPLGHKGGSGTWAFAATPPGGLTLDPATGALSGPVTAATGSYPVSVSFTETSSATKVTKAFTLTVVGVDVAITTDALDEATRAQAYSQQLTKTGATGTWTSSTLPDGLTLSSSGLLSGIPQGRTGTTSVTITFTEGGSGTVASRQYDLSVGGEDLGITTTALADATRGTSYAATLAKTGGDGTWAVSGLPAGVGVNTSTGALSGTVVGRPRTYGVTVTFTESATGLTAVKSLNLVVTGEDIGVSTTALPDGTTQTAYSQQLVKTGLAGTWSWTYAGTTATAPTSTTSLPGGLTLSSGGLLSGTPSGSGDWNLVLTFTETASGLTASRTIYLHVSPKNGPVISPESVPNGVVGSAYGADLSASPAGFLGGGWRIANDGGALPPGLSLSGTSGRISGTPTQAGDFTVIVRFTQALEGGTNTRRYTIHIDPAS